MILASQSPRRRDLLQLITPDFRVIPADIDESLGDDEEPDQFVSRLAEAKARAVASYAHIGEPIIGSDTTVSVDGMILNKPSDLDDFLSMMNRLSGRTHQVSATTIMTISRDRRNLFTLFGRTVLLS